MCNIIRGVEIAHCVDLIFHQSNQRRDDNSRSLQHHCRKLVAKRLACAGRHEHERVLAVKDTLNDLLLIPLESVKTEVTLQIIVYGLIIISYITLSPQYFY